MASAFSFGFSGDDIDMDNDIEQDNDVELKNPNIEGNNTSPNNEAVFPAERYLLSDWTTTLPSQISYNTLNLDISHAQANRVAIGRRELFDVRTQLMAEDDDDFARHEELISDLEQGDLKPKFYEGGFKTWECSLDLAELLSFEGKQQATENEPDEQKDEYDFHFGCELSKSDAFHVIELGCGTAVPSLAVFAQFLSSSSTPPKQMFRFTLADYNSTVLRLVTLSNFLLTWWLNSPASPKVKEESAAAAESEGEGELDIDATLLDAFQADLASRGITLDFISGGWSPEFVQLVLRPQNAQNTTSITTTTTTRLILASETIYSPSSLGVFSETLLELLRHSTQDDKQQRIASATALIAAKKVYFGVGGGVDEFLQVLYNQPLHQGEESIQVQERKEINSEGVKRVVLQVRLN